MANPKLVCENALQDNSAHAADVVDIAKSQNGLGVGFPVWLDDQAGSNSVQAVLGACRPFEILSSVVSLDAVQVVHVESVNVSIDKRTGYENVDLLLLPNTATRERHMDVASGNWARAKDSPNRSPASSTNPAHAPEVRNLVDPCVSIDWPPLFDRSGIL